MKIPNPPVIENDVMVSLARIVSEDSQRTRCSGPTFVKSSKDS